jgi:hypothetical protein
MQLYGDGDGVQLNKDSDEDELDEEEESPEEELDRDVDGVQLGPVKVRCAGGSAGKLCPGILFGGSGVSPFFSHISFSFFER